MCGVAGMFSTPSTRGRMPQITRAPHRIMRHQIAMKRNRGTGGSQPSASTAIAYGGVTTSWNSAKTMERSADMSVVPRPGPGSIGREQRRHREREVREDHRVLGERALAQRLLALAGEHEHRLAADGVRGLQVAQPVADHRYAGHVHAEALRRLLEQPGLRFAAVAAR